MSENKNIVIKVKYPSPGNRASQSSSQPGVVTEWNYKRIGLAVGSLILVIMLIFFFTESNDNQSKTATTTELVLPAQPPEVKSETAEPVKAQSPEPVKVPEEPKLNASKVVARAHLTSDINKNEPVDHLKLPLKIGKNETLWIYYFVELKGMDGKTVFHEWWLNGNLVSRKKINISDDSWRTASKQLITYTHNNDWIARVVDDSRNKLAEISFNLELKK